MSFDTFADISCLCSQSQLSLVKKKESCVKREKNKNFSFLKPNKPKYCVLWVVYLDSFANDSCYYVYCNHIQFFPFYHTHLLGKSRRKEEEIVIFAFICIFYHFERNHYKLRDWKKSINFEMRHSSGIYIAHTNNPNQFSLLIFWLKFSITRIGYCIIKSFTDFLQISLTTFLIIFWNTFCTLCCL